MTLTVLFILTSLTSCSREQVPEGLFSGWATNHQDYQNCYMIIEPQRIVIFDAQQTEKEYSIKQVRINERGSESEVIISTVDPEGVEFTFHLVYVRVDEMQILHYRNLPDVLWRPASAEELRSR